jgi:hypothetical protein
MFVQDILIDVKRITERTEIPVSYVLWLLTIINYKKLNPDVHYVNLLCMKTS